MTEANYTPFGEKVGDENQYGNPSTLSNTLSKDSHPKDTSHEDKYTSMTLTGGRLGMYEPSFGCLRAAIPRGEHKKVSMSPVSVSP